MTEEWKFVAIARLADESPAALKVLCRLCVSTGTKKGLFITQGELARSTGYARETVSRAIAFLEQHGLVESKSKSQRAKGGVKTYHIDPAIYATTKEQEQGFYLARMAKGRSSVPEWRDLTEPGCWLKDVSRVKPIFCDGEEVM